MANYILLERIELNASAASVTFSNIPQTGYTDLKVVMSMRSADVSNIAFECSLTFNGNTTGYTAKQLYGDGSSAASSSPTVRPAGFIVGTSATASTFSNGELYIPNYTSSNYKSYSVDSVTETNATTQYMNLLAGLWSNTAAITSIALAGTSGSFAANSTFSLYGLAAVGTTPAIAPKASGGNITTDGTYWIHTFLSSGTFTPQIALSCDYLVVAGGGGGGSDANGVGGGGGAGGARTGTSLSALAQAYTITVGAGGAGGAAAANSTGRGSQGTNSSFSTISSTGGGGGGNGRTGGSAGNGGSGGGGCSPNNSGGTGISGEGYAGGTSTDGGLGGGGGGANATGGNSSGAYPTGSAGSGGSGLTSSISGTSTVYAGGGGGGAYISGQTRGSGGTGGGGNGANGNTTTPNSAGTTNTGGGGGAGSAGLTTTYAGAAGGSGIVIIRYAI